MRGCESERVCGCETSGRAAASPMQGPTDHPTMRIRVRVRVRVEISVNPHLKNEPSFEGILG